MPLRAYFKGSRVKLEIGLARGKRAHDKRDTIKRKDIERDAKPGDAPAALAAPRLPPEGDRRRAFQGPETRTQRLRVRYRQALRLRTRRPAPRPGTPPYRFGSVRSSTGTDRCGSGSDTDLLGSVRLVQGRAASRAANAIAASRLLSSAVALLDDVEPGAMVHGRPHERQAEGHVDGVRRRRRASPVSGPGRGRRRPPRRTRPARRARRRCPRAGARRTSSPSARSASTAGHEHVLLLAAEQPALAGVRIEPAQGHARPGRAEARQLAAHQPHDRAAPRSASSASGTERSD